jgi:hypothetical protein
MGMTESSAGKAGRDNYQIGEFAIHEVSEDL